MSRTILLTINNSVNVRDILRSDVYETLKASGHRVVLATPAAGDRDFRAEFAAPGVVIEPLVRHQPGWLEQEFDNLRITLFPERSDSLRILAAPRRERSVTTRVLRAALMGAKQVMGPRVTERVLRHGHRRWFPDRLHGDLFARHRPDLVVVTEVFNRAPDSWILKRAVAAGIPTVWLVRSWDNLTAKGIMPAVPDRLVVWGPSMREEAVAIHGMAEARVFMAGSPHWDVFTDTQGLPTRQAFFERIGADPARKLVTYAMAPAARTDEAFETAVVEHLWRVARDGRFGAPAQVLARVYPLRGYTVPPRLAELPGLLVDLPGRPSSVFSDRDITRDDLRHLAATLTHSDVIVNLASTVNIEAAICGTPAVCVAFDLDPSRPYLLSHMRYFDYTHHRKLRATGGIRLATSLADLERHIDDYLRAPDLDADGRQRILQTFCHGLDGRSGTRVGRYILDLLEGVGGGPRQAPAEAMTR